MTKRDVLDLSVSQVRFAGATKSVNGYATTERLFRISCRREILPAEAKGEVRRPAPIRAIAVIRIAPRPVVVGMAVAVAIGPAIVTTVVRAMTVSRVAARTDVGEITL